MLQFHPYLAALIQPEVLIDTDRFQIKLATTEEERELAFRLRYEVFNLEQGKGLAESAGEDRDHFDDRCFHLIVIHKPDNRVIGTYRLHPGPVAVDSEQGFYSSSEFNIEGLAEHGTEIMELGRSCVHPEFRSGAVVALLWSGLSEMLNRTKLRYMIGCVSLEDPRPLVGWTVYAALAQKNTPSDVLKATPMPGYALPAVSPEAVAEALADPANLRNWMPPLLKGYLRVGAQLCGEPVFDFAFGTTDFLLCFDTTQISPKYLKHYTLENTQSPV